MSNLSVLSLFSGCGGFDIGALSWGCLDVIWANDIDAAAAQAYKHMVPCGEFHHGDVQKVQSFPKADILIGCYPCTGFSMGARRRAKGMEERDLLSIKGNFLYQEFLRALDQANPKYFFVENVTGMVSAKNGWFFEQQKQGFNDKGYTVYVGGMFGPDFGLAQSRNRIFIAGVRKDIAEHFIYPGPSVTHGKEGLPPYRTMKEVIGGMPLIPKGEYLDESFHGHYLTRQRKRGWGQQSYTIVASGSHVTLHPAGSPMKEIGKDKWILQGDFNRRLSWRECARLQGFDDSKFPEMPLKHLYKVIGNAVPPAFGRALVKPVLEFEGLLKNKY